jgi:hypothetical protein
VAGWGASSDNAFAQHEGGFWGTSGYGTPGAWGEGGWGTNAFSGESGTSFSW